MTLIDLVNGLSLQVYKEFKLTINEEMVLYPFLSLIELNNENILGPYYKPHNSWGAEVNRITVNDGFYWIHFDLLQLTSTPLSDRPSVTIA